MIYALGGVEGNFHFYHLIAEIIGADFMYWISE